MIPEIKLNDNFQLTPKKQSEKNIEIYLTPTTISTKIINYNPSKKKREQYSNEDLSQYSNLSSS